MRDADGRFPKLLDFGISKAASAGVERTTARNLKRPSLRAARSGRMRHLTALGAALGTPAYMSPEQLRNQSDLDARADLYSLGVVLYEWLSGSCPYASTSDFGALYQQIRERSMKPLERVRPELGAALCQVVTRALAFEAKDRFASAAEMREALLQCASESSGARSVVQSPSQALPRMGQKTQVLLESAGDPFADPDEARFLPRFPLGRVLLGMGCALALGVGLWLSSGNASKHDAKPAAPIAAESAGAPPQAALAPPPAQAPPVPAVTSSASATDTLPLGADMPEQELPLGADMPAEDLPVSLPAPSAARRGESTKDKARISTHEKRRERTATQPTDSASAAAQSSPPASSSSGDPPIRQKVVRQLDF
jgi:hypothetical protein